ncbi:MAG: tripartite tricarboxylate transporter substrate binding protein [Burkholderiaceae bacterium]
MNRTRRLLSTAAGLGLATRSSFAAPWAPDKPITFVVPFTAGSATDQLARALGQAIAQATPYQVVVENRPGANAFIGAQAVAHAPKDGHTLLIGTNTTHAANQHLFKKLPYDPVRDFEPVALLARGAQILIVGNQSPVRNVHELVELARAQPGKLSFGSGSSSSRIAGELFKQMTGTFIVNIPYRSNPPAVTDLIGGQIDMMITDMATGLPQVRNGKVRALGVSSLKRVALAPEIPTISEAGVTGYEMIFWFAAYAPGGTPAPMVARLNEIVTAANRSATMARFYADVGFEALSGSPQTLARFQADEAEKWGRIITKSGIEKE